MLDYFGCMDGLCALWSKLTRMLVGNDYNPIEDPIGYQDDRHQTWSSKA